MIYYLPLLLWSLIVGAILGLFGGNNGIIRGVVLCISLSFGTIIINYINLRRLNNNIPPRWINSFVIGGLCGLVAGIIMACITFHNHVPKDAIWITNPVEDRPSVIIIAVIYGFLLHGVYALRWRINTSAKFAFTLFLTAVILGIVRQIGEGANAKGPYYFPDNIYMAIVTIFLTSVPFTFAWCAVQKYFDPAWSFDRWETIANENNR